MVRNQHTNGFVSNSIPLCQCLTNVQEVRMKVLDRAFLSRNYHLLGKLLFEIWKISWKIRLAVELRRTSTISSKNLEDKKRVGIWRIHYVVLK